MTVFTQAKRIAVIRRNGLGDLLCAMPLISYCRELAPQAEITLYVNQRSAPLAPYLRGFDHLFTLPAGNKYLAAIWAALKCRHRFDIAISAKPTPMKLMNLSLWMLRAKYRFATVANEKTGCLVNSPQKPCKKGSRHQALATLQIIAPHMHTLPRSLFPKIHFPFKGEKNPKCTIFISLTNNRETSSLGIKGYERILNRLKRDIHVIISCEPRDADSAYVLAKRLKSTCEVCPSSTLHELLIHIERSDVVFVGDGGIMHLAAALNKRQIVLFGAPIAEQWHPLSDKAVWHVAKQHVLDICPEKIAQNLDQITASDLREFQKIDH